MSSEGIFNAADTRSEVSAVDLRAGLSATDVKSVIAATLLSADFVLDPDSKHQWFYDSFVFADAPSFGLGKNPDDAVTVNDAISQIAFGLGKTDAVSMSDAAHILLEIQRAFSEVVAFSDLLVSTVETAVADQQQITDSDSKGIQPVKADSFAFLDVEALSVGKGLADQFTLSESISLTVGSIRVFSDNFSLDDAATVDAIRKDTANTKTNVFGFSDSQAVGVGKAASDSLSFADAIDSLAVGKGITDTVNVTETFSFSLFTNAAINAATLNSAPFNQ